MSIKKPSDVGFLKPIEENNMLGLVEFLKFSLARLLKSMREPYCP
jgi:hypothetical protein